MVSTHTDERSSGRTPLHVSLLPRLTMSHLWRFIMVFLMTMTFVFGSWSTLVAFANPTQTSTTLTVPSVLSSASSTTSALSKKPRPHQPKITHAVHRNVSSSVPFDGLGDLPFYTYVTFRIDDRVEMKVNVADGNLLVHTSDLHLQGTGLNESLEGYYNSQADIVNSDHGNNWNFSYGHDVRLDLSNPTQGITFHGPSGYSAFFAYNPQNPSTYIDAPGLNATLVANNDGTYTLTYHHSGEQLIFGTNSHLAEDEDKNGNQIAYSYNSTHDLLSILDTQNRTTTFTHNSAYGSGNDPTGQLTSFTDPSGRQVQFSYNERSNPTNSFTTLTDASGSATKFDYNGNDLTTITDPMGNITTITYLNGDKVSTITDATNNTITFNYTSGTTVVTDRDGNNTTYTWNANEPKQYIVTNVSDALGHSQATQYDGNYDITQYTDGEGDTSAFTLWHCLYHRLRPDRQSDNVQRWQWNRDLQVRHRQPYDQAD